MYITCLPYSWITDNFDLDADRSKEVGYTVYAKSAGELLELIFRTLQDTIDHPCRSKDWFGMTEHDPHLYLPSSRTLLSALLYSHKEVYSEDTWRQKVEKPPVEGDTGD